jgi:hypothetical protein
MVSWIHQFVQNQIKKDASIRVLPCSDHSAPKRHTNLVLAGISGLGSDTNHITKNYTHPNGEKTSGRASRRQWPRIRPHRIAGWMMGRWLFRLYLAICGASTTWILRCRFASLCSWYASCSLRFGLATSPPCSAAPVPRPWLPASSGGRRLHGRWTYRAVLAREMVLDRWPGLL